MDWFLVLDRPNPRTVRNGHCGRSACQRKRWRLAQLRQRSGRFPLFTTDPAHGRQCRRSEEHTSELQSLMRISYAVFCLKKKNKTNNNKTENNEHTIYIHHTHKV